MIIGLLVAFIQMTFLPGYIILSLLTNRLKLEKQNGIEILLFSFVNSLLSNYLICLILIILNIFIRPVLVGVFIFECAVFLYLFASRKCAKTAKIGWKDLRNEINIHDIYWIFAVVAVSISIIWAIWLFFNNVGTVFMDNDAIGAYNQWAVALTQGKVPGTNYYPLLIVSNWAVAYVLAGSTLQFAAKAIMPLFIIYILAMLISLYAYEKKKAYLLAVPCVCIIVAKMSYFYICEGSMDYAVSFFAVGGIYCIIRAYREKENKDKFSMYMIMAGTMVISIGITKQAGLLIAPLLVIFAGCLGILKKISKKSMVVFGIMFSVIVISFYLWSYIGVQTGTNASYVNWLIGGIHGGRNWIERIAFSTWTVYGIWYIVSPIMAVATLVSLLDRQWRWVNIVLFFPYTVVWMLGFSYDTRNWTVGMILWGIAIAFGVDYIMEGLRNGKIQEKRIAKGALICMVLGVGIILYRVPSQRLENAQIEQQKKIVDPELNAELYSYFDTHKIDGKILSYMSHVGYLPELADYCIFAGLDYASDDEYYSYYEKITDKDVAYIIFPDIVSPRYDQCPMIKNDLEKRIAEGKINIVWQNGEKMFATIEN